MKHKFLAVIMAITTALCMAFSVTACGEKSDETGNNPPITDPSGSQGSGSQSGSGSGSQGSGNQGGGSQSGSGSGSQGSGEQSSSGSGSQGGTTPDEGEQNPGTYSKGLRYTEIYDKDGTTVIGYSVTGIGSCKDTKIFIPETYEEKPVTSIGGSAFISCKNITSVTIPDGVTLIGSNAFNGCSGLTSITIPDSVTEIGNGAFSGCSGLAEIKVGPNNQTYHANGNCLIKTKSKTLIAGCKTSVIPDDGSVTSIGSSAFYGCSGLTSVIIPDSVTAIGTSAFSGCSGLTEITIPFVGEGERSNKNTSFGYIFGASKYTENSKYVPASLKKVTITRGTLIGAGAFRDCSGLISISIPDSVTSIEENAFGGCSGLTELTVDPNNRTYQTKGNCLIKTNRKTLIAGCKTSVIPDDGSVTEIGEDAFYGCSGLTSITIPDSVTEIGEDAFAWCSGLQSVTIGSGVTVIKEWTFLGCSGLTSIIIPDSVTGIRERAFEQCSKLASVTIGSGVTSISGLAFFGCSSLKEAKFKNPNGWKASVSNSIGYIAVTGLDNPATAAKYLKSEEYSYFIRG